MIDERWELKLDDVRCRLSVPVYDCVCLPFVLFQIWMMLLFFSLNVSLSSAASQRDWYMYASYVLVYIVRTIARDMNDSAESEKGGDREIEREQYL